MEKIFICIAAGFLLISLSGEPCLAKHLNLESFYQEKWCQENSGQAEVTMPDKTRCDCLTKEYAIEFDISVKNGRKRSDNHFFMHYRRTRRLVSV